MKALRRAFKAVPVQRPAAQAEHRWLRVALVLSLLFHALLLSLTFSGPGPGLPGLGLPWQERRGQASELRVVLLPAPAGTAATALPPAQTPQGPAQARAPTPEISAAPTAAKLPAALAAVPALVVSESTMAGQAPLTAAVPALSQVVVPATAPMPTPTSTPTPTPTPVPVATPRAETNEAVLSASALKPVTAPEPALMTTQRPDAAPVLRAPLVAAAPPASSPDDVKPSRPDDSVGTQQRMETQRQAAQLEAQRQAAQVEAQRQAAQVETQRVEAARQQAARQELARQEAVKQENTRREAERAAQVLRQETERQEAAQVEMARLEAARLEAALLEAARLEAQRQSTARQAAVQAAGRAELAQQDEARREASRRAMGRQLDEEAAKRDAARRDATQAGATSAPPGLPPAASSRRRGRLLGRTDANTELVLYAEAWARKIQLNMTFEQVREAATKPHTQPVVTVSIRSDGSVESVLLVRSSGVPDIDEAVQRIVRSLAPYPAFSPALSGEFDVIEIRRTWHFDTAIRLY